MKILLDYLFPITAIEPTPEASTAFLKQVCVVGLPKDGGVTTKVITEITSSSDLSDYFGTQAAAEAAELFSAGMTKVYVLPMDDLEDLADTLDGVGDFFTLLFTSEFDKDDITATQASGNVTITNYSNLLTTTPDKVTIAGVDFTAQSGAVTPGEAKFQAATSNTATAASLAAQINAHATVGALVSAANNASAVCTITAIAAGWGGNDVTLAYTDNGGGNVGATVSGANLTGGDGLEAAAFGGVIGISEDDDTFLATQAAIANRCAFHVDSANGAKNMFYAFGKLLSNSLAWRNQQYIPMPVSDDVETVGDAEALFDDRISFVISDDEFGARLGFFACGGKAIVEPYVVKNLQIDMQSEALSYISGNQPAYTHTQAALLEDELQSVIDGYIDDGEIEAGEVEVTLENDNFVASGAINISEPKALWRIVGEMRQTL